MDDVFHDYTEELDALAVHGGTLRQQWHEDHKSHDRYGATDGINCNIEGCKGEVYAAAMFGVVDQWVACCDDYKGLAGDIAPGIQIRATSHANGRLLLHPWNNGKGDNPAHAFGLVKLHLHCAELVGWIRGEDGQLQKWWCEPSPGRPCFAVPVRELTHFTVRLRVLV